MNELNDIQKNSLVAIATESYRFQRTFEKVLQQMSFEESRKYQNQLNYYAKKVSKSLDAFGIRILDLEGKAYDPGMPVSPINIEDFEAEDQLFIQQTVEPIIMMDDAVLKMGTVLLGRNER